MEIIMSDRKKLIFATGNQGKMNEIRMIMADLNLELLSLKDLNMDINIEENGKTFEENALKKAKEIFEKTKIPCIADDSGIEIEEYNRMARCVNSKIFRRR